MEEAVKLKIYLLILVFLIAVLGSIWVYNATSLSPNSAASLEDCKILTNPGGEIGLLFFSTKDQAQEYSSYLLSKEPFKDEADRFAVRYIDTVTPECELYDGKALLCYSKNLIQEASSCPYSYIFVPNSQDPSIRSSSYMGVMSINTNHPFSVVLHEFGHAFANFAEEYAPARIPRGSKNCASSCDSFTDPSSCFEECSDSAHFRSIDEGIMRTLDSESYGTYNDALLQEKIKSSEKSSLSGFAVAPDNNVPCNQQKYLLVEATYVDSQISVLNKEIKTGCPATTNAGPFTYQVSSTSNAVIAENTFNPEPIFTDVPTPTPHTDLTGQTYDNTGSFYLSLPITDDSQNVEFLDENNKPIGLLDLQDINSRPCKI